MAIPSTSEEALRRSEKLGDALSSLLRSSYKPHERKTLRLFSAAEAASFLRTTPTNLRQAHNQEKIIEVSTKVSGRRMYSSSEIQTIRGQLEKTAKSKGAYLKKRGNSPMAVVAVSNFKGGSAKTTTAAHMAHKMALDGYRVLACDLDPQGSLSALMGFNVEIDFEGTPTLYDALRYGDPIPFDDCIYETHIANLHCVPASLELQTFEHETARVLANQNTWGGKAVVPFYDRLKQALASVEDSYDVVIIDCPPQLGFLTMSAITAANGILVTCVPGMMDVHSMNSFLRMAGDLMEVVEDNGGKDGVDFFRFLITRHEPTDGPQIEIVTLLRHLFGSDVLTNTLLKSTAISDAALTEETIYEVDRSNMTKSTYDRARQSVDACVEEVEQLILQMWGRNG
ncbi:plasmid partitioning protein RepA [Pseudoruegeria sp. SK021]|nr:plasmid partitioning protein RepA [Pseudoruegeria sp. SK021]